MLLTVFTHNYHNTYTYLGKKGYTIDNFLSEDVELKKQQYAYYRRSMLLVHDEKEIKRNMKVGCEWLNIEYCFDG